MIYLVRHADAGDKATWRDADLHRPLSPRGWREAVGLAIRLEHLPIDRIVASPALRCAQTVRPLAARTRLPVDQCDLLGVGADPADVAARISGGACDRALLCTHREVLTGLLPILIADGLTVTGRLEYPKGGAWILHRAGDGSRRATLLPARAWPPGPDDVWGDVWRPPRPPARTSSPSARASVWRRRLRSPSSGSDDGGDPARAKDVCH